MAKSLVVTVKTIGAEQKFQKALRLIQQDGEATVLQLARLGRNFAKDIAPKYTGKTISLIKVKTKKLNNGATAQIQAQNSTAGRADGFNLVRWMHTSPRAAKHIKTGDEKFMFTTRNYLNSIKKSVATGQFKNINLR
jgi:hypothetical protein